ncbi:MAG TPA: hypothetical protein VH912_22045 [Streptosporangiaceae bacterium]|jgi:hypothetical protein
MSVGPISFPNSRCVRVRWAIRRLGLYRSELRRPVDRAQSAIALGLFLVFLVLGPIVTLHVVQRVYDSGVRTERQHSTRQQVEATVVEYLQPSSTSIGYRGRIQWRAADGSVRSGTVITAKPVGGHLQVWVDKSGAITGAPQTRTLTIGTTGFAGAGGLAAVGLPLAFGYALVRRRFERRRFADWDAEWSRIAPLWTGRG